MASEDPPCVFCAIVARTAPASVVYEDGRALAFLDIRPVNPGHTLVIPKPHHASLAAVPEPLGAHLFVVAQRVAGAIRRTGLRCEGINLFVADGAEAFQEIFHFHMHVLPRFKGDAFRIDADWSAHPGREELDDTARRIRAGLP